MHARGSARHNSVNERNGDLSTASLKSVEKMGTQYTTCPRGGLKVDRCRGVDVRRAAGGAKGFVAPERYRINGSLT
jgi:hypothetical protein